MHPRPSSHTEKSATQAKKRKRHSRKHDKATRTIRLSYPNIQTTSSQSHPQHHNPATANTAAQSKPMRHIRPYRLWFAARSPPPAPSARSDSDSCYSSSCPRGTCAWGCTCARRAARRSSCTAGHTRRRARSARTDPRARRRAGERCRDRQCGILVCRQLIHRVVNS